jgi:hypothetical protein
VRSLVCKLHDFPSYILDKLPSALKSKEGVGERETSV